MADNRSELKKQPTKVLKIEVPADSEDDQPQGKKLAPGEMSPAFEGHQFKKAAKKMNAVGNETSFPRNDNYYMGMESLSYQDYESKIFKDRKDVWYEKFLEWFLYAMMGMGIGFTAFIMDIIEESLVHFKDHFTQHQIDEYNLVSSWLFYASFSAFLGVVSCTMTTFWGPGANGSGVAEIIGYVNGINYPNTISVPTFITKVFGVVLAVAGTLCVGKEGPLAHIGANWGVFVIYAWPYRWGYSRFDFLKNDHKRRQFIAAGASAGVAAAFSAPIGGALFIYELSKPNTYWKFSMLWKTFLSCSFACVTMAMLEAIVHGKFEGWTASALKFGKVRLVDVTPTDVLAGAIVLGVISGLLGPLFINVNTRVNAIRAKIWTRKWHKPIDTFLFAFASASCFYWFPYLFRSCTSRTILVDKITEEYQLAKDQVLDSEEITSVYQGWCHDNGQFDPLVSLFWQTEGGLIRDLISESIFCSLGQMVVFCCVWYFWTIITYGTQVPSGLFLPGMIIGCALGEIYAQICLNIGIYDQEHYEQYRATYIILGMGGMLAGYTRMTYSLAVITMETSQAINIFIPIIFCISVSNFTGALFTRGLYDRAVRAKQMPILKNKVPQECKGYRAEKIMSSKVVSLRVVDTVKNIYEALKKSHNGFPVTNYKGQLVGLIPKKFLLILLEQRQFYSDTNQKYFVINGYMKKLLNSNKYLDTSNVQHPEGSRTEEFDHQNGYEVQSYLEKMMNKSQRKEVNHEDVELMGLPRKLKTQKLDKLQTGTPQNQNGHRKGYSVNTSKKEKYATKGSQGGIPKKLMEIHNNEVMQKTGGYRDEISEDQEVIQMESEKSSQYDINTPDDVDKKFSLDDWLDQDSFPKSQNSMIADWNLFTVDFIGSDKKLDENIKDICEKHQDKMIDLRPYMIENVYKVTKFDALPLILSTFREHHLRHLIVVNPNNNKIDGVITRQDIFMYMPL